MIQVKQKKAIVIITLSLLILFGAGIGYYLLSPSSMVAIDVNPSIEIHTNRLGEVVSIDPVNDDAIQLMAGYQLTDKNLETVIHDIVDRMILNGYLVNQKTDELLVSTDRNSNSDVLLNRVEAAFHDYLQEKQIDVTLFDQKVDMDDANITLAHQNRVSVGKMALINKLKAYSSDLKISDFTGDTVKELVQYAKEHNISLGKIIKKYHEVVGGLTATPSTPAAITPTIIPTVIPTVIPTPEASSDNTKITISTFKNSRLEDVQDDTDKDEAKDINSNLKYNMKHHKSKEKFFANKSDKVVKGSEDADDDTEDFETTVNNDQEDSKIAEDSSENENEDSYLEEDYDDNDFQGKEDRHQVENSQDEEKDGYSHGDEGDDD